MWYVQFNLPNSAPYRYLTVKKGIITSTRSERYAVIFRNKLQAISAAESAIRNNKRLINSYRLRNLDWTKDYD